MKINYKNTALGLLDHIDPFAFRMFEDAEHSSQAFKTEFGLNIIDQWPIISPLFKDKIQYISDPFYNAYNLARPSLSKVIGDEELEASGTFISRVSQSETNTIFYYIKATPASEGFKLYCVAFFFVNQTGKDKPCLAMCVQRNEKGVKEWMSETATKNNQSDISVAADIYSLLLFLKYCDLQTKIVKPKSKENHINCKYVNDTASKIEILDSTWFTTIVRSDGFGVRGHFRMQPFGQGMAQRRLTWIDPFEKHGYTRKAKILQQ